jgi:membrane fusion protein (multidrug efflux system)
VRPYLLAIALLGVLAGAIGGYQYLRFSELARMDFSPPPVTIAAADAQEESWTSRLDSVGTLRAVRGVELTAETSGQITAINFDSGQRVQKGQLLVVLNDEVEQAARKRQQATLELARVLHERDLRLIGQKSIAQSQFDTTKADLGRAEAELAETEARIRNKRIHAPFDGALGIRRVALGDYVEPGTPIASLQDGDALEVDFTVPARHVPRLAPGQRASVRVDAWPDRVFAAELQALDSAVDAGTRNILLRARMIDHEGLLPGMFANIRLELGEASPVVTVPETAVTYSLQGDTVWVVVADPQGSLGAEARIVRVGETREGRSAILSGIAAGDRVVVAGQNKLYPGVKILVDESMAF